MKKANNWFMLALAAGVMFSCQSAQNSGEEESSDASDSAPEVVADNTLTEAEVADGWMLLFDGQSTDGWRGYRKDFVPQAWRIDDGAIQIQGSGRGELGAEQGGDIIYAAKAFGDFHLKIEWRVDSAANSGIFYRGQESEDFNYIWKTSPEMQVLDNVNHPDASKGTNGNRQSSSLYDLIAASPQNSKPFGNWNQVEVLARGNEIRHIQNGDTVVSYTIGSERMDSLIAISKWPNENPNWREIASEGYIGLQDHGDNVWFKNIKLKEL